MKRPNLAHAVRIARVEVRRSVRAVLGSTTKVAAFGIALLFWTGLPTVGGGYLAFRLGRELPAAPFPVLDAVRGATAVGWVGVAALAAARAAGKKGELDAEPGLLTTVPARDAALGLLLSEYVRMVLVAAIPIASVSLALAVGAGTPAPLAAIPTSAALLLAVALCLGFTVGIWVKRATVETPWLARNRTALLVGAFALYFVAVTSEAFGDAIAVLRAALGETPLAWFGDAALLGLPGIEAVPAHALGAAAMTVVALPALAAAGVRSATTLWYTDAVPAGGNETERKRERTGDSAASGRSQSLAERALATAVSRPTRTVTLAAWRRAKRAPMKLVYVAYPLFFLYAPLRSSFESGVPSSLPALVAVYGTWAAGATVLNPLGDEGSVLPTTLLSGIDGRRFVAGHVLSASLVGVPVVVAAVGATGAASPLGPGRWLALTAASAALVVAGSALAVGVGALFPRFGAVELFRSREVVVPSKGAFAAYSLALMGGAVGVVVAVLPPIAGFVAAVLGLPQGVVRAFGGGLAVLVGVVGPVVSFHYAMRRFDEFTVS